eukprot:14511691-Alexandrium_andersonii.AAC.1
MSIYGSPTAAVASAPLKALRSAIATLVDDAAAANRAPFLALGVTAKDMDPWVHIVHARVRAFRRMATK